MPFLWRRKRRDSRRGGVGGSSTGGSKGISHLRHKEITIPTHFRCPITLDLMKDPVSLSTGITYDRESIEKWIDEGHVTCPVSNQVLRSFDKIPNHALRKMIQDWCVENRSHGVERIPTPRIPVSPYDVSEFCSRILASVRRGDEKMCVELLVKIKRLAKESERNKQCIVSNGIGSALATTFESFARASTTSIGEDSNLLKDTLSMLTWSFPLGEEGVFKLKSQASLNCLLNFLQSSDPSDIQNAIFVLKDLAFEDQSAVKPLIEIKGIEAALLHALRMPIIVGVKATQACLMLIHLMIEHNPTTTLRFIQQGLITTVLDILVDGNNKGTCENALRVLDGLCNLEEGKKIASANALTVPLVVKKILRVSDIATRYSIGILWKIGCGEHEDALIEAVQHGGFQKLLVVLQVGCGEGSKEKTTELLRLMNRYRNKLDCFESSMGFKYVRKSN